MDRTTSDRSLGELFGELTKETTTLVRQEVALARTEMSQKVSKMGKDVASLAVGGAVAYAGFLAILAALIIILAQFIPWWLSALVVGLVVAGIGYMLVQRGLSALKKEDLAPRQTIETIKEDTEWAKEQIR
jgi:predicted phage tail protein